MNFALILVVATFITGVVWVIDKVQWLPKRKLALSEALKQDPFLPPETQSKLLMRPPWVENIAGFFPVIAVVLILRSFVVEPFRIPSGSMKPTLLIGDFILVNKFSYGIKLPVSDTVIIETGKPKRGDIAVFRFPPNPSLDYIKRVVGLPGDKVVYKNKSIYIEPACPLVVQECSGLEKLDVVKAVPDTFIDEDRILDAYVEQLGDVSHRFLVDPYRDNPMAFIQPGQSYGEWVVPDGHYFMMGDNRDNSADSRFWGFVSEKHLVGEAFGIWLSMPANSDGSLIWTPPSIRFSRLGGID